jgi:hypothetical protein
MRDLLKLTHYCVGGANDIQSGASHPQTLDPVAIALKKIEYLSIFGRPNNYLITETMNCGSSESQKSMILVKNFKFTRKYDDNALS